MTSAFLLRSALSAAIVATSACSPQAPRTFEPAREEPVAAETTPKEPPAEKAAEDSPPFFERAHPKESGEKKAARDKMADEWVEKQEEPLPFPTWREIFASLERKHGKGQVPCKLYDSLRHEYFNDQLTPWLRKEGRSVSAYYSAFMEASELPTRLTLTGRVRVGCKE